MRSKAQIRPARSIPAVQAALTAATRKAEDYRDILKAAYPDRLRLHTYAVGAGLRAAGVGEDVGQTRLRKSVPVRRAINVIISGKKHGRRGEDMVQPQRVTFDELSARLREYERQYGYSTIEFYRRYENGELGDDDEVMLWAGLYHLYLTSLPIRQFMVQQPVLA